MKQTVFLLIVLSLFGCAPKTYEIAYVSDRNGSMDIFLASSDTTKIKALTQSETTEYGLVWAADGKKIYYTAYKKDGRQFDCYDLESGTTSVILEDSTIQSIYDVSKDQQKLLISTKEDHKKGELYTYDLRTKVKTRITDNNFIESGAKFSKHGTSIVASIQTNKIDSLNLGGNAEIFELNLTRHTIKQLTNLNGFCGLPAYSPDNKKIAFHNCNNGKCNIYVMHRNGRHRINLTKDKADNKWPRWTPDGKWIAFSRTDKANSDIYFVSPNGKNIKPVLDSKFREEIGEVRPFK